MKSIRDTLTVIQSAIGEYEKSGHNASAALIGGHAAILFGVERTTLDVDIFFHSDQAKASTAFHHFLKDHLPERFNLRLFEASKDPDDPLKHDLIIIDDSAEEYPRIDILVARYRWELEGLEQAGILPGLQFPIMPLPYLMALKLLAGGRKDELDIIELSRVASKEQIELVKELARKIRKDRKFQSLYRESS